MDSIGLYIHIPFCESKCSYCAFTSFAGKKTEVMEAYIEALIREILEWKGTDVSVRTVYFGGGTPSCIPVCWIKKIVETLEAVFHFDFRDDTLEKTIEVNPASAIDAKLAVYKDMGFNRLSIGLQTARNHLLKSIGRIHTLSDFDHAVKAAERRGFYNISADLLFGLPGQTVEDVRTSVEHLLSFKNIRHISCYSLKIEEETPFALWESEGKLCLPSEDTEREMYYTIIKQLTSAGFDQYEISNFAIPGYESRHNSAYWDLTSYLGFGLSAASFYHDTRFTNTDDLNAYCNALTAEEIRSEKINLSPEELRGDFMFLGLRRCKGVDDRDYQKRFGRSFFSDYKTEITELMDQDLIIRSDAQIRLTAKGMDFANRVFAAFV